MGFSKILKKIRVSKGVKHPLLVFFEKSDSLRENLYNFSKGWLKKAWMGFQKKSQKNQGFQRGETPFGRSFGEGESLRESLYYLSQGWLKKA
ncbi:MAG: hypothetical protein J5978_02600 [Spirochaetaceae bacterium]|nr:hypothetical protein [Spirochaetaceae bacterium]